MKDSPFISTEWTTGQSVRNGEACNTYNIRVHLQVATCLCLHVTCGFIADTYGAGGTANWRVLLLRVIRELGMKRTPTQLISASVKVTFDTSNSTHFTCKGEGKRYYALTVHHCRMSDRSVVSLYADDEKEVNRMRHVVNNNNRSTYNRRKTCWNASRNIYIT